MRSSPRGLRVLPQSLLLLALASGAARCADDAADDTGGAAGAAQGGKGGAPPAGNGGAAQGGQAGKGGAAGAASGSGGASGGPAGAAGQGGAAAGAGGSSAGGSAGSAGSAGGAGATGAAKLLFGVVEEQLAVCFAGENYPCAAIDDDDKRRGEIAKLAPGLTVRWGGFETERTGFGYPGAAARRAFENVGTKGSQLEPSWLVERAKKAGYGGFILTIPVTVSAKEVPGGSIDWKPSHAAEALDAWKDALAQKDLPPPAFIELGNEPWNKPAGTPDGFTKDPQGYAKEAREIGKVVAQKIASFGWPTRIAVVVDNWPGTRFESPTSVSFPAETIALAAELAALLPGKPNPVLQTHAYPLHGGYWCPKAGSVSDASDLACVYALYTMLSRIKQLAPQADILLTEDNFDAAKYPDAGVYTTLSALLAYAAGAVAYTHFGNNDYDHKGDRYELFNGLSPVPLLAVTIPQLHGLVSGLSPGDVSLVSTDGEIAVKSGGYPSLVNEKTAPAPFAKNGSAPAAYVFQVGAKTVSIDVAARTVAVAP